MTDASSSEIAAQDITIDREAMELRITFTDGTAGGWSLTEVRLWCPCAQCRTDRQLGQDVWPKPNSPIPLGVSDARLVGGWGLGITWNDGHDTGIYPWDAIHEWARLGHLTIPADSGL